MNATGATVYTENGIVTLQGVVGSMAQEEMITEYVRYSENVEPVKNEMTIGTASFAPDSTIGDIDNASIMAEVES